MDQRRSASMSRVFFMDKAPSSTNELIYQKTLTRPIVLSQQNSLEFLSISGWKNWSSPFVSSLLNGKLNEQDFIIRAHAKGIDENVIVHLLSVPQHLFTFINNDEICAHIQKMMIHHLGPNSVVFDMRDDGFLSFQILDEDLELSFSPFLCNFFGFTVDTMYSSSSKDRIFFISKGFRDFRVNIVGIALNFVFNPDLSESNNSEIKKYEIISLLDTTGTSFSAYYKKVLISQPENNVYKTLSCQYVELRFIDLATGKVLTSFFPNNYPQEIHVKISFS